ncbi:MAG: insulinase family protein [Saprospiraceae bacterium]|nr:insulinase family protein [Saprospiraceae bacterium]
MKNFKKLNIQKLKEELTKNEVITYRLITEEIFGKSHAYGYNSTESDYNAINQSIIKEHFENYYGSDNRFVFISGKITDTMLKQLEAYFGSETKPSKTHDYVPAKDYFKGKSIQIILQNEHQSAIKTGMKLFNKIILTTILFCAQYHFGGYFGSRLMSKIRGRFGLYL